MVSDIVIEDKTKKRKKKCIHCDGTGEIDYCPLCRGIGMVAKDLGNSAITSVPCPNGCPPPSITY